LGVSVASFVVDGLVLPIAIGGHPAVDFCNTRTAWGSPTPKEYLVSYEHLVVWAVQNGLLAGAAGLRERPAPEVLEHAIALRDALYDVLVGPRTAGSWAVINAAVRAAGAHVGLRPGVSLATWEVAASGAAAPLHAVAWSAADLLTTMGTERVQACLGERCGWLFHNPTGRRRWCSMAWCGNRAKARRHARRSA
jgi:predicted RNA-binding Zn ribbon-like protein